MNAHPLTVTAYQPAPDSWRIFTAGQTPPDDAVVIRTSTTDETTDTIPAVDVRDNQEE